MYFIRSEIKNMKKISSMVLIFTLIIGISMGTTDIVYAGVSPDKVLPQQSNGYFAGKTYLALGDSIAVGLSADEGEGYVDFFFDELKGGYHNLKLLNYASEGATSHDLLEAIKNDGYTRAKIRKAEVITISIGANNLLRPIVSGFYDVIDIRYPGLPDPADPNFEQALAGAIVSNPEYWNETIFMIMHGLDISDLMEGYSQFVQDWPQILWEIKELNGSAEIYVMTIYNPLPALWSADPDYAVVYFLIEALLEGGNVGDIVLLDGTNDLIRDGSSLHGYTVADVYTSFIAEDGAVKFLDDNIISNPGYLDPHPNPEGHGLIFDDHKDLIE